MIASDSTKCPANGPPQRALMLRIMAQERLCSADLKALRRSFTPYAEVDVLYVEMYSRDCNYVDLVVGRSILLGNFTIHRVRFRKQRKSYCIHTHRHQHTTPRPGRLDTKQA